LTSLRMMAQMQQQIQEQFSKLGMSGPGFAAPTEALPKSIVRETAKKFVTAQGSSPIGANDAAQVEEAFLIAQLWLNDATFFPQSTVAANLTLSRSDWVDSTLTGWQSCVEPLAVGLTQAITQLLQDSSTPEAESGPEGGCRYLSA